MSTWVGRTLIGLVCGVIWACGSDAPLSDEDARKEFGDVVAASNSCTMATECALVLTQCPLGCYAAVNASQASAVQRRADDIMQRNRSGGHACSFLCIAQPPLTCESGHCALKFDGNR